MIEKSIVYIVGDARHYLTIQDVERVLLDKFQTVEKFWFEKHGVHFNMAEIGIPDKHLLKQYITVI